MSDKGIEVTVRDLANGDHDTAVIEPGNYVVITANPCYIGGEQHHGNGTVVITIKRPKRGKRA